MAEPAEHPIDQKAPQPKAKKPRKARRGRGEGSIFLRADGLWGCAISNGTGKDGKRRRRVLIGKSKLEVQQKLAKMQQRAPLPDSIDPGKLTTSQYLHQWLQTDAKQRCRPRSWENHDRNVRCEIEPALGKIPLAKLSVQHILALMADLEDEERSPFVRANIRKTLNRALNCAVKLGLLVQNPCSLIGGIRLPRKPLRVLSPEDTAKFLAAAEADRLYAMYVLAITGGLRQGELFGLQWADLDLDSGTVLVQRSLDRKAGLSEPKTAAARRRVELPGIAVEALKGHRDKMVAEGHGSAFVFCDTEGGTLRNPNVVRRSFRPILDRAGLARIRFHDLRHSHASLLLLQGENPKIVQERLGHAKIELTLGTYSHLLPGIQRAAADRLDAALIEAAAKKKEASKC